MKLLGTAEFWSDFDSVNSFGLVTSSLMFEPTTLKPITVSIFAMLPEKKRAVVLLLYLC